MSGTLSTALWAVPGEAGPEHRRTTEASLDQAKALDRFLAEVEQRALRIAEISVRDRDDALDIVQDAMIQLARRYAARPPEEWKALFYRILRNRIFDWQRRRKVRGRVIAWWTGGVAQDDDEAPDPIDSAASAEPGPDSRLESAEAMQRLEAAIGRLPARQAQAFMLRSFEGLDVAETALAMGCSEGSVKTHHFRATQALRAELGDHWP